MPTRQDKGMAWLYIHYSQKLQSTFYSDAAGMWNMALDSVKNSKTLYSAKREIKKFILTLPIKS